MLEIRGNLVIYNDTIFYYDGPKKVVKNGLEHTLVAFNMGEPVYAVQIGKTTYLTKDFKKYKEPSVMDEEIPAEHIIVKNYFYSKGYRTSRIMVLDGTAHLTLVNKDDEVFIVEAPQEILKTPEKLLDYTVKRIKIHPALRHYYKNLSDYGVSIRDEDLWAIMEISKTSVKYFGEETTCEEVVSLIETKTLVPFLTAFERPEPPKPLTPEEIAQKEKILTPNATIIVKNPENVPEELWPYIEKAFGESDKYMVITIDGKNTKIKLVKSKIPTALKIGKTTYYYDAEKDVYVPNIKTAPKIKYNYSYFSIEVTNPNRRKVYLPMHALTGRMIKKLENGERLLSSDVIPGCNVAIYKKRIKAGKKEIEYPKISFTPNGVKLYVIYKEGVYLLEIPYDNEKDVVSPETFDEVPEEYIAESVILTNFLADEKIEYMTFSYPHEAVWTLKNGTKVRINPFGREKIKLEIKTPSKTIEKRLHIKEYNVVGMLDSLDEVMDFFLL